MMHVSYSQLPSKGSTATAPTQNPYQLKQFKLQFENKILPKDSNIDVDRLDEDEEDFLHFAIGRKLTG